MASTTCSGCSTSTPEGSNFCPTCGGALGTLERPRRSAPSGGGWVTFLDRCWDFFASTKVAVVLIILIAIASAVGSLIEQENLYNDWRPPDVYYPIRYGEFLGNLYLKLGLTHTYSSIWFAVLILLIVTNLIICSFHRLVPLHRTLTRPQVWKLPHFIKRQEVVAEVEGNLDEVTRKLGGRGYKLKRDRECLYGDKGRLSRYGPYIIHIGLLMVAFAAFAKAIPGWDQSRDVWIPDGQTVKVPDTDFAIMNHKFTMELYPSGAPAKFATDASVLRNGQEVVRKEIEVNHPLPFGGWNIYQASFKQEPGVAYVKVMSAINRQPVSALALDLRQPETEYKVTDRVKMVVRSYFHDLIIDQATQEMSNASYDVKNPVFRVEFIDTQNQESIGAAALPVLTPPKTPISEGPLYLEMDRTDTRWYTLLKLHKDLTTPYMFAGLAVVMFGMMITFFIFHWQVWVREENGKLVIGARAFKNKFGLKQEIRSLVSALGGEETIS